MDFSSVIPRDYHSLLAYAGKNKVFSVESYNDERSKVVIDRQRLQSHPDYPRLAAKLAKLHDIHMCWFFAASDALANGPKIFIPTEEQCDSMKHVELRIPISFYRQSFPSIVVQIPYHASLRICEESGLNPENFVKWILVHNAKTRDGKSWIFLGMKMNNCDKDQTLVFQDREKFPDIESAVTTRITDPNTPNELPFFVASEICSRIALNLMLLLTNYEFTTVPLDPKHYYRHREKKHLEHLKFADFLSIHMKQAIIVRKTEPRERIDGEPTGRELCPHWRKGHWRNQACGERQSQHKLIFIRPVLIREDRVLGDIADSETIYKGR